MLYARRFWGLAHTAGCVLQNNNLVLAACIVGNDLPLFRARWKLKSFGHQSFSVPASLVWNNPPPHIQHSSSLSQFKTSLKTFHFTSSFSCDVLLVVYLIFGSFPTPAFSWCHGFLCLLAFSWTCTALLASCRSLTEGFIFVIIIIIIMQSGSHLIYPITMRVFGALQMISQPVSSIFPFSPLPSGTWGTPGLSSPWRCLPTCSSVCLVLFPLTLYQSGYMCFWCAGYSCSKKATEAARTHQHPGVCSKCTTKVILIT